MKKRALCILMTLLSLQNSCNRHKQQEPSPSAGKENVLQAPPPAAPAAPPSSATPASGVMSLTRVYKRFAPFEINNGQHSNLKNLVQKSAAEPEGYIALSNHRFLVLVRDAGYAEEGLYYVDTESNVVEKLMGGGIQYVTVHYLADKPVWAIASTVYMGRGVSYESIESIVLSPKGSGNTTPVVKNLLSTEQDGESGLCGEGERASTLGLDSANNIVNITYPDINHDLIPDVQITVAVQNCISGEAAERDEKFEFHDGHFIHRNNH